MTRPSRPTLPESEYRIAQWLRDGLWGTNYVGRIMRRLMIEYDRRGAELGISGRVLNPGGDMPTLDVPCHKGKRGHLSCGHCQSLIDVAAGDVVRIGDVVVDEDPVGELAEVDTSP